MSRWTNVKVVVEVSKLERHVWEFTILEFPTVYLEYFGEETRPSTRHRKWDVKRAYNRLPLHRSHSNAEVCTREEPAIPDDVLAEAMRQFREKLTFKKWDKR